MRHQPSSRFFFEPVEGSPSPTVLSPTPIGPDTNRHLFGLGKKYAFDSVEDETGALAWLCHQWSMPASHWMRSGIYIPRCLYTRYGAMYLDFADWMNARGVEAFLLHTGAFLGWLKMGAFLPWDADYDAYTTNTRAEQMETLHPELGRTGFCHFRTATPKSYPKSVHHFGVNPLGHEGFVSWDTEHITRTFNPHNHSASARVLWYGAHIVVDRGVLDKAIDKYGATLLEHRTHSKNKMVCSYRGVKAPFACVPADAVGTFFHDIDEDLREDQRMFQWRSCRAP